MSIIICLSVTALFGCTHRPDSAVAPQPDQAEIQDQLQETRGVVDLKTLIATPQWISQTLDTTIAWPLSYIDDQWIIRLSLKTPDQTVSDITSYLSGEQSSIELKKVSIWLYGSRIVWKSMAPYVDYMITQNLQIEIEGEDLVITPDYTGESDNPATTKGQSFIVFTDQLPTTISLQNKNNLYDSSFYLIPQQQRSMVQFDRSSDFQKVALIHDGNALINDRIYTPYNSRTPISIVKNKKVDLIVSNPKHTYEQGALDTWYVSFNQDEDNTQDCIQRMDQWITSLYYIKDYLAKNNLTISACDSVLDQHGLDNATAQWNLNNAYRQAVMVMQWWFTHIFPLNHDTFAPTRTRYEHEGQYGFTVNTPFILKKDKIVEQCNQTWINCQMYGERLLFSPIPGQKEELTIEVENIFGQKKKLAFEYTIGRLHPNSLHQKIISNDSINILPRWWDYSDILLEYINTPSFDVSLQKCEISELDVSWWRTSTNIEDYLFNCEGEKQKITVSPEGEAPEDFSYRKTYRTAVDIPAWFRNSSFKVTTTDAKWNTRYQYVTQSDIAIWAKKSWDQTKVWAYSYQDGQAVDGEYQIKNGRWEIIDQWVIREGKTEFTIPEVSYGGNRKDRVWIFTLQATDGDAGRTIINRHGSYVSDIFGNQRLRVASHLDGNSIISSEDSTSFRWRIPEWSLYGYAARWLYKPGETIDVSWFLRDMKPLDPKSYADQSITISLSPPGSNQKTERITVTTDKFGWFEWSFVVSDNAPLGSYYLQFEIGDDSHSTNVLVEEYTKPSYSIGGTVEHSGDSTMVSVSPYYFFGTGLSQYDIQIDRSIAAPQRCSYCRWYWDRSEPWYSNTVLGKTFTTGGSVSADQQSFSSDIVLYSDDISSNILPWAELKVQVTIKDTVTNEIQFRTWYETVWSDASLTLEWRIYDRLYRDGGWDDPREDYMLEWNIDPGSEEIDLLEYDVYYYSYENTTQQWVDGNLYYVHDRPYTHIYSQTIDQPDGEFSIDGEFLDEPWSYVISVRWYQNGKLLVQNDKSLNRYFRKNGRDLLGPVPNNYTLTLSPSQETYTIGETMSIDLLPYPRGARAVVVVEQAQYILDTYEIELDGGPIELPIKQNYLPQVSISVMALQPTTLSEWNRNEPRFYAGYTQVAIDTQDKELTIDLQTDREVYKPWDQVTLQITTTDHLWNPVDARVSIAVIDKALTFLYDINKDPLSRFFRRVWTSVQTYTNMKLLYQSLKVFATDGSKGWSWVGGDTIFTYIREQFLDQARRDPSIYTVDGKAEVSFTLPDNMTTWVVDAVAISNDLHLGATQQEFTVKQALILEWYVPRFMTIGDQIEVPYKLIFTPDGTDTPIIGKARITDASGDQTIDLSEYEISSTDTPTITLKIPDSRWDSPYIQLHHQVSYGDEQDSIVQQIPLRTQWMIYTQWESLLSKEHTLVLTYPESRTAELRVIWSTIPTDTILPSIQQTLYTSYSPRYSSWATNQLAWLADLTQWIQQTQRTTPRAHEDQVYIGEQRYAIDDRIGQLLQHIQSFQMNDGSIRTSTYSRHRPDSVWVYQNSYITFHTLLRLRSDNTDAYLQHQKTADTILSGLGWYLKRYSTVSLEWAQLAMISQMRYDQPQIEAPRLVSDTSWYKGILDYLRSLSDPAYQTDGHIRDMALVPTNNQHEEGLNTDVVKSTALYIQALLRDTTVSQTTKSDQIQSLLAMINDSNQCVYCSPLTQMWMRQTMIDIWKYYDSAEKVTCTLTIDDVAEQIVVVDSQDYLYAQDITDGAPTIARECDEYLFVDAIVTYMPTQIKQDYNVKSRTVKYLEQWIKKNVAPDQDWVIVSIWTQVAAEDAIVNIHIPATLTLFEKEKFKRELLMSDGHCRPDHYELRYDRVVLYYESLEPWTCDIYFPALQTFSGSVMTMPIGLYEMNRWLVRATTAITQYNPND